jgi:hypothetical protein
VPRVGHLAVASFYAYTTVLSMTGAGTRPLRIGPREPEALRKLVLLEQPVQRCGVVPGVRLETGSLNDVDVALLPAGAANNFACQLQVPPKISPVAILQLNALRIT